MGVIGAAALAALRGATPAAWKLAAVLALLVAAGAAGWRQGVVTTTARWQAERADRTAADLEAERLAQRSLDATRDRVRAAEVIHVQKARRAAAAAAGTRDELDRLRDALAAAQPASGPGSPPAAAGAGADDAARARVVVGECAGALYQVAQAADACEARLSGLQGYVRAVVGAAPEP